MAELHEDCLPVLLEVRPAVLRGPRFCPHFVGARRTIKAAGIPPSRQPLDRLPLGDTFSTSAGRSMSGDDQGHVSPDCDGFFTKRICFSIV